MTSGACVWGVKKLLGEVGGAAVMEQQAPATSPALGEGRADRHTHTQTDRLHWGGTYSTYRLLNCSNPNNPNSFGDTKGDGLSGPSWHWDAGQLLLPWVRQ